jgi:hypothetical protein
MDSKVIAYLTAHIEVDAVYFNAEGEWMFRPYNGFDKVVSRAEALGESKKEEEIKKPLKTKEKE